MSHLVDTSILGRLANTADAYHATAARAVVELHRRGEVLHITPQNLIEFRSVATRPAAVNGLGLTAGGGGSQGEGVRRGLPASRGRLVAVCHVHGVTHLLTFSMTHFARLAGFGPGIVVVDPTSI